MKKSLIIGLTVLAVVFALGGTNIEAHSQQANLIIYNASTRSYYFQGRTRYANQPLEAKMLTLQDIMSKR